VTSAACPSEDELVRAFTAGADARVSRHVADCSTCRVAHESLRHAIALAKDLPARLPRASRRDEVKAQLLASAAAPPVASTRRWFSAAAAIVVLGAAGVLLVSFARGRQGPAPARSHVTVRAEPTARFALASPPPLEVIRLWEGAIDLDVEPLGPGERVRVEVGDGEVEVRGTRFQVTARGDRLVAVSVTHGRVEVRPRDAPLAVLGAGQEWRRGGDPPAELAAPVVVDRASQDPAARPRRIAARTEAAVQRALRPTQQEARYDDAWDALRAGRFKDAAAGFGRVLDESPPGPLVDEAAFWRATALARDGESASASAAFRSFLASYRASPRSGEASAILGWLLLDDYRTDEAAPLFRAALGDPRETVRASAREGLDAIARTPRRR
jgi:TolA-binding protein